MSTDQTQFTTPSTTDISTMTFLTRWGLIILFGWILTRSAIGAKVVTGAIWGMSLLLVVWHADTISEALGISSTQSNPSLGAVTGGAAVGGSGGGSGKMVNIHSYGISNQSQMQPRGTVPDEMVQAWAKRQYE